MTVTIEIHPNNGSEKPNKPKLLWKPEPREHTYDFLERKQKQLGANLVNVLEEAQTILGRCTPPTEISSCDTGLVVGYVQSGKTLSFETVISLARDNGYRMIILIAGTANHLKGQSVERLKEDFDLKNSRSWDHYDNPDQTHLADIQNSLGLWSNPKIPSHKRTSIIITVLKQAVRLRNLISVLRQLRLEEVPTLIIDDEGDQASLNNKGKKNLEEGTNETSTIYDRIVQLKSFIPHHTLLQYTATPQANFLINISDILSPSFAELLTPGEDYVGGKEFFHDSSSLVEIIPEFRCSF